LSTGGKVDLEESSQGRIISLVGVENWFLSFKLIII
jgi:hypothetical protein